MHRKQKEEKRVTIQKRRRGILFETNTAFTQFTYRTRLFTESERATRGKARPRTRDRLIEIVAGDDRAEVKLLAIFAFLSSLTKELASSYHLRCAV